MDSLEKWVRLNKIIQKIYSNDNSFKTNFHKQTFSKILTFQKEYFFIGNHPRLTFHKGRLFK